ncbi:hypothetical protein DFH27DRAFT_607248 [Peziza echinospora]|nr:hypothetical protein DFH27DRAFT_607248 [Peziza echinospora]
MARPQVSSRTSRYRVTPSLYALLAISAGFLLRPVSAQETACQRFGGSAAVANGRLFYTGGWYRSSKATDSAKSATDLMSIDLSKTWKYDAVGMTKIGGVPALYSDSEEQPLPVLISSDDSIFNVFASTNKTQGYTLSVTTSKWEAQIGKIGPGFNGLKNLVYTQSTIGGKGWAIGQDAKNTDEMAMAGFDLGAGNITSVPWDKKTTLPAQGQLQYLPIGQKGALIYFGGTNGGSKVSLDNVFVFDIADQIWREQQTTGTAPGAKSDVSVVCSTYAAAKDASSHSIYVFTSDGNVYILTLPGFMWIQMPMKNEIALDYEPARKSSNKMATCVVAPGSRQVVVLGVGSKEKDSCDKGKGVFVYDMTELAWKENYDKDMTGYEVPSQVFSKIGGGKDGKATLDSPERGWSTTGLRKVFTGNGGSKTTTGGETKAETSVASSTASQTEVPVIIPEEEKEKKSKAPMLGGVIAAIVVLGLFAGLFIFWRKKRGNGRRYDDERPKISSPLPQKEDTMGFDAYSRKARSSVSKVDTSYDYSLDSRASTWSPDGVKKGRGTYGGTIASSTLYTPSAYLNEPISPATFQGKFPPPSVVSDIASFKGFSTYAPSRRESVDTTMMTPTLGSVVELPAHLPAKAFTHSNRASTASGLISKDKIFFGELEGDYSFPIEMGGGGPASPPPAPTGRRRESSRSLTLKNITNRTSKSGKSSRGSKEYLLQSPPLSELGVPEPAVLSPGARSPVSPLNRRSTGILSQSESEPRAEIARTASIRDMVKEESAGEIGGFKMDEMRKKKFAGKAKLVDMKRGASQRKKDPVAAGKGEEKKSLDASSPASVESSVKGKEKVEEVVVGVVVKAAEEGKESNSSTDNVGEEAGAAPTAAATESK